MGYLEEEIWNIGMIVIEGFAYERNATVLKPPSDYGV